MKCPPGYTFGAGIAATNTDCQGNPGGWCVLLRSEVDSFCQNNVCTIVSQTSDALWLDTNGNKVMVVVNGASNALNPSSEWSSCVSISIFLTLLHMLGGLNEITSLGLIWDRKIILKIIKFHINLW